MIQYTMSRLEVHNPIQDAAVDRHDGSLKCNSRSSVGAAFTCDNHQRPDDRTYLISTLRFLIESRMIHR